MAEPAVFLDRDGTLVHVRHYPTRPEELVLYDGIGPDLRWLREAGFRLVVITNQSGLARGLFTVEDLQRMHGHLFAQLERFGARPDAVYFCPHHPDGVVSDLSHACGCRKPEPGMLLQAAAELDLDLARSWFLGDILDDVEAGNRAGCRTILVDLGTEAPPSTAIRRPDFVARDTIEALRIVRRHVDVGIKDVNDGVDKAYWPECWRPNETATGEHRLRNGEAAMAGTVARADA